MMPHVAVSPGAVVVCPIQWVDWTLLLLLVVSLADSHSTTTDDEKHVLRTPSIGTLLLAATVGSLQRCPALGTTTPKKKISNPTVCAIKVVDR
jgi:hypothetical protein